MQILPRSTPEAEGISSTALRKFAEALRGLDSVHSVMVMRHGRVVAEGWKKPYGPETPHMLFSLSKSFTSCAVGFACAEGKLSLDARLVDLFRDKLPECYDPKFETMRIRHLLSMTSGHDHCMMAEMENEPDGDYVKAFLSSRLTYEPGTHFVYNSGASYMLSAVVRKVSGENPREYLLPRLFEPLGIVPGIWESCPRGTNFGGWGFNLKTEDLAKFAQLLLDDGKWDGRQLIPLSYLHAATTKQIDNSMNGSPDWKLGYGYQFWMNQHGYRGDGACGQYAIVIPEYDMAIAVTSGLSNMQSILTIFWETLLPGIRKEMDTLPEDPAGWKLLKDRLSSLSIPLASGNTARRGEPATWMCPENDAGIRSVSVSFGANDCTLEFDTANGMEKIHAGFGFNCDNLTRFRDSLPRRCAASAAWKTETLLEIHVCNYETPFRDVYHVDFSSRKVTRTSNTNFLHPDLGLS